RQHNLRWRGPETWARQAARSNIGRYLRWLEESRGTRYDGYDKLWRWSVTDLEGFWRAVERDLDLVWTKKYESVLDDSRGIPWTTWWTGGRMNYVATALRPRRGPDRVAVIAEGEEGTVRRVSYGQLARDVGVFAAGLRALGVAQGDRVAVFMPMTYECV
ncbi:MAG: acetyl-coenzyme A synthetase N-terminal domain-containing protein, partial [Chloroflexota bacterium]